MARPSPLRAYVDQQRVTDGEIRRTFAAAARLARKTIERLLSNPTFSNKTQAKRLEIVSNELQKVLHPHWETANNAVSRGIRRASRSAASVQAAWEADLRRVAGKEAAQLPGSYRVAANRIATQYIEHGFSGKPLSHRVYKARDLDQDRIRTKVRSGILLGQSPKAIATEVERHIKPTVPGGTSYAAMRVARTEMQNAFHDTAREAAKGSSFVQGMEWHLSGSHPEPDECNVYAERDKFKLGKGVFPVGSVPDKPHPQCLCFITPKLPSPEEFIAQLRARRNAQ